jgi:hypothetical protein
MLYSIQNESLFVNVGRHPEMAELGLPILVVQKINSTGLGHVALQPSVDHPQPSVPLSVRYRIQ